MCLILSSITFKQEQFSKLCSLTRLFEAAFYYNVLF
jgi:hypothetical protein